MPRRPRGRVNGPYPARGRFRVVLVAANGARRDRFFDDKRSAEEYAVEARKALAQRHIDVATAVETYNAALVNRGLRPTTVATAGYRLRSLLSSVWTRALLEVTAEQAAAAYTGLTATHRPDTHRNTLKAARAFFAWAVAEGFADVDPFAAVKPVGARSAGKPQLRFDEARRLFTGAALGARYDRDALAVLTILLTGLRASEVIAIAARDVDDRGTLLWVPRSKTAAGVRRLRIPPELGSLLNTAGPPFAGWSRWALAAAVRRMTAAAGLPPVGPHGLRGTHASIAAGAGATAEAVGRALGHADRGVTAARHYIDPSTSGNRRGPPR